MNEISPPPKLIGSSVSRVEGALKVTGKADYTSDYSFPKMAWAFSVKSQIANGSIINIDTDAASKMPGVVKIYTYQNRPTIYQPKKDQSAGVNTGEELLALKDATIHYEGQEVAWVVAETYEQARAAAAQVHITYKAETPAGEKTDAILRAPSGKVDGLSANLTTNKSQATDVSSAWSMSDVKISGSYKTSWLHHHPMEPHSAVAYWEGDRLTCYTPTQWMYGSKNFLSEGLGISDDRIRVISHYLGGGFGCKGSSWMFLLLTCMAAKDLNRPVKYVMEREDMFTLVGHRPETSQHIMLGAKTDGTLTAIRHLSETSVSTTTEFLEATGHRASYVMYQAPAIELDHKVYPLNLGAPCQMRAPGESPGMFALETAMDELAIALKMDPLKLRQKNLSDSQPFTELPFSSKSLSEAYETASKSFGWDKRNPAPRTTSDGDWWVGSGMATSLYPANRTPTTVKVRIMADGTAEVLSATQDLGTGTYTIMSQMAADELTLPMEKIKVELGDSSLPKAGVSGGSMSAGSVLPAVQKAAQSVISKLGTLAVADKGSPLYGLNAIDLVPVQGGLQPTTSSSKTDSFADIVKRSGRGFVEVTETVGPPSDEESKDSQSMLTWHKYAYYSFGAYFAEVRVHKLTSEVLVSRVVTAMDIGQPLNLKTARSQVIGGAIFQIGAALSEHSILDTASASWITRDLGTYHVPVNSDVPEIDVHFVGSPDFAFNSLGARGVGEIGNTGLAAAIGNAIYHATGTRLRELPFTVDKMISARPA